MRSASTASTPPQPLPHTPLEDAAAILTGVLLVSVGVILFKQAGLVTGGMAGLAFALDYATDWSFGLWFFCAEPALLLAGDSQDGPGLYAQDICRGGAAVADV